MLEIGSVIDGKYKVLSEVGRGGMSVVYMAINEKANKTWAIKEVRKDGVLDFEAVRQGLIVETDMLKRLHHPNLPSIVDVIEDDKTFLIVMDYVEGNALSTRIAESGAQREEDVIKWAKQICDVLSYLHSRKPPIIYRDMKPANIMLKPNGDICLIDFGTAREYKARNLEDTTCLGTIGYAAPEQFGGMGQTDVRTDIYGLGATLYHLVTGVSPTKEPPYYGIRPIREINPALSSGLEHIIETCTQANPNKRYQSCAELKYALEHYEEIDDTYRRKQKYKLTGFIAAAVFSMVFLSGGIGLHAAASQMASNNYVELLSYADLATNYDDKLDCYQQAIAVPHMEGKPDAYLNMIDMFENYYEDDRFTSYEENILISLVTQNEESLKNDTDSYVEVCFEIGRLYWYYYDCGDGGDNQATRAKYAVKWFQKVIDVVGEDSNYENMGMAIVYSEVGNFYTQVTKNITVGDDLGTYAPFFGNLCTLMNRIAVDNNEKETVRLELCALTRNALDQYAAKFKVDEITYEEMISLYEQLESCLNEIATVEGSMPDKIKKELQEQMESTLYTIQVVYGELP